MRDNGSGRCVDCAIALGHLGVLAEALSGGVGDWEARMVAADQAEHAQQAGHIRGLLARAAEELDELAATLAEEARRVEAAAAGEPEDEEGHDGRHLEMLRRAQGRDEDAAEAAVSESRWEDAALGDADIDEAEAEADLAEEEFARRHSRR